MRTDTPWGTLPAREHLLAGAGDVAGAPVLDVVVPVYNEEKDLEPCVLRLHDHLARTFPYDFRITVADNASTDRTAQVARRLAAALPRVRSFRLEEKGRGRALRTVWSHSDAPVLAYMDVDLSTDLNALLPLVAPLISGHSDLAIGSRLARSSRVVRGTKRRSGPAGGRVPRSRSPSPRRHSGRTCCSAGPRTICRGCGRPYSSPGSWARWACCLRPGWGANWPSPPWGWASPPRWPDRSRTR
ncbi:glycosyltransferase [Streptomyces laculatispora]|uniref:glycosyltransferase n=1 Tax=Streptomyces laculatispora TaxID=887464 RepID=UPI003511F512